MLIIPDRITIQLIDETGKSVNQENILIGIRTRATTKNDIEISPFSSDKNGVVIVTKSAIQSKINEVIQDGIMDYASIEMAYPEVEIFILSSNEIDKRIKHLTELLGKQKANIEYLKQVLNSKQYSEMVNAGEGLRTRLSQELEGYLNSYNLKMKIATNSSKAVWDREIKEYVGNVQISS